MVVVQASLVPQLEKDVLGFVVFFSFADFCSGSSSSLETCVSPRGCGIISVASASPLRIIHVFHKKKHQLSPSFACSNWRR